jgi:hypothetical protein
MHRIGTPSSRSEPLVGGSQRDWLNAGNPWVLEPKALPAFLTREPTVLNDRQVMMFSNHLTRYVRAREDVARKS